MIGKFSLPFFLLSLFFSGYLFGQSKTDSPYSRLGIGDINSQGTIRNIGMGGTGVSYGHPEFINLLNPALLPVNRLRNLDSTVKFTMFESGLTAQFRTIQSSTASQSTSGLNMAYFAFAFPLSPRWTSSVGLQPFSSVHNIYTIDEAVVNDPSTIVRKYYNTKGGISRAFISNGYDISKLFSVGLDLSYLFGNINTQALSQFQPYDFSNKFGYQDFDSYSGFQIKPGAAFRKEISKNEKGERIFLNAGLTYDYYAAMQVRKTRDLISLVGNVNGSLDAQISSLRLKDSIRQITLPQAINFGLSLDKPDYWLISVDASYIQWSSYKDNTSASNLFNNSYTVALGGEFKFGKKELIKRKDIRAGISYSKSPLTFNGTQLNDYSFSLGTTIPVSSRKASPNPILPKLNLGLVVGRRGTTNDNLLLEYYIKTYLGITVNDKWFRKRKIE